MNILFKGKVGNYSSKDSDLPSAVFNLKNRGILIYLGTLNCSRYPDINIHSLATPDGQVCVNVMISRSGLEIIDCISKFLYGSFLTTTNASVLDLYKSQGLHRISRPNLAVEELLEIHIRSLDSFRLDYGAPQPLFTSLLSVAKSIDEYIMRTQTNFFSGLVIFIGGLFTFLRQPIAK
jgi:hypothetical protein